MILNEGNTQFLCSQDYLTSHVTCEGSEESNSLNGFSFIDSLLHPKLSITLDRQIILSASYVAHFLNYCCNGAYKLSIYMQCQTNIHEKNPSIHLVGDIEVYNYHNHLDLLNSNGNTMSTILVTLISAHRDSGITNLAM